MAELIPDTMVVRRLPQLWLSVTALAETPGAPSFAVLVRHSGNEFYSLINQFSQRLDPPAGFPAEVLIRGSSWKAQRLLNDLRLPLADVLANPRVKEVAVTARGVRIVIQAAEGRRGEHLLLRQATFDSDGVQAEALASVLAQLDTIQWAISQRADAVAA